MATPFPRTLRSLASDGRQNFFWIILIVAILLSMWGSWFFLTEVSLYEVSETARLEQDQSVYAIEAQVLGRVVAKRMKLADEVRVGDVLVELDADIQQLQIEEEQARLTGLELQLDALRNEIKARARASNEQKQAAIAAVEETHARQQEAEAGSNLASEQAMRDSLLHAGGHISKLDLLRTQTEQKKQTAAAAARTFAVKRLQRDLQSKESTFIANLESLKREAALLESEIATAKATIKRLVQEIGKRRIRAPVTGRIGEVAEIQIGSVVDEGDKLGTIVPKGQLKVVAEFHAAALGRIQPGQPARLQFEGFPWIRYGMIAATVARVASEVRDQRIRVELTFDQGTESPIPLQHGLPGRVEVEVDKISPALLVLQTLGRFEKSRKSMDTELAEKSKRVESQF